MTQIYKYCTKWTNSWTYFWLIEWNFPDLVCKFLMPTQKTQKQSIDFEGSPLCCFCHSIILVLMCWYLEKGVYNSSYSSPYSFRIYTPKILRPVAWMHLLAYWKLVNRNMRNSKRYWKWKLNYGIWEWWIQTVIRTPSIPI